MPIIMSLDVVLRKVTLQLVYELQALAYNSELETFNQWIAAQKLPFTVMTVNPGIYAYPVYVAVTHSNQTDTLPFIDGSVTFHY